jgi:GNAT superfamily N-acetyltransferase
MASIVVRALLDDERGWMAAVIAERWGGAPLVSARRQHELDGLDALIATVRGERVGLLCYCLDGDVVEIVTLDAFREGAGIGQALIEAIAARALDIGAYRLVAMTTNDNTRALRIYQQAGFRLLALRAGAVERARRVKPSIPQHGRDGIPIHDEIDLVRDL